MLLLSGSAFAQQPALFRSTSDASLHRETRRDGQIAVTIDDRLFESFRRSGSGTFALELDGKVHEIIAVAKQAPAERSFATIELVEKEGSRVIAFPTVETLYGEVAGDPNSFFHLSRIAGTEFYGTVYLEGRQWSIAPATMDSGRSEALYVIAPERQGFTLDDACGVEADPAFTLVEPVNPHDVHPERLLPDAFPRLDRVIAADYAIDIALDVTFEFYDKVNRDEQGAINYLTALFAEISAIYEREVQTRLRISYMRIWKTENDPYNAAGPGAMLAQLQTMLGGQFVPTEFTQADQVFLLHASKTQDNVAGVAYIGGMCRYLYNTGSARIRADYSYPTDSFTWDVALLAHEIGHVVGALHTHCYNPPLDRCHSGEQSCYSGTVEQRTGTIMSYCRPLDLTFHSAIRNILRQSVEQSACVTDLYGAPNDLVRAVLGIDGSPIELDRNADGIIDAADAFLESARSR